MAVKLQLKKQRNDVVRLLLTEVRVNGNVLQTQRPVLERRNGETKAKR